MSSLLDRLQPPMAPGTPVVALALNTPGLAELLADLPGNILQGHGRRHTALRLVKWKNPVAGRTWASEVGRAATSHEQQMEQARRWREGAGHDTLFIGLYVTARGAEELGIKVPENEAFREGLVDEKGQMTARATRLGDVATDWENPADWFAGHALLVVAGEVVAGVAAAAAEWTREERGVEVVWEEDGERRMDAQGYMREAFGFRDGLSRMEFLQKGNPSVPANSEADAYPLSQVLREVDRGVGSFVVLRQMQQNTAAFAEDLAQVGRAGFGEGADAVEQAAAWVMGRFRDGTPREISRVPTGNTGNNFVFKGRSGCPAHAHIRKMNPRGMVHPDVPNDPPARARLPVRRSVPYGVPGGQEGLLFIAFMADIAVQFEHLLEAWAREANFPLKFPASGLDPVLAGGQEIELPDGKRCAWRRHTVTRGGVYLWAPPLSVWRELATNKRP